MYELYALGLLEGEEKDEADAHLGRECPTCRKSLHAALAINTMLIANSPAAAPSSKLRRRILATVGIERSSWSWAAALAAVCMLAVALWLGRQERERGKELAAARDTLMHVQGDRDKMLEAFRFLNQPETKQVGFQKGPRGNVFVNSRAGVMMIAANLPKLSGGWIFEMWLIPKGGAPRPAGLFTAADSGDAFHILSGPVDIASLGAVAVTIEPEAGSRAPTSTPIIAVPVAF
ncbi:MAG: anti-sigma factor [Acidobacteriia bacterium]|nr:anti-sigma factor [Terriglobia bacterium]